MLLQLAFVMLLALGANGQVSAPKEKSKAKKEFTPESEKYLLKSLNDLLKPLVGDNLFDGPASVSNAPTPTNKNKLPTKEQLNYYMYYAGSSYFGYDLKNLSCEYCLKFKKDLSDHKVLNNETHDTVALATLSKKRKEIVIAFRGTLNVWNTVLDFDFKSEKGSSDENKIQIHRGFRIATMSLYTKVVETVKAYLKKCSNCKVVIVGHSLGGAMASLAYFFLKTKKQFPKVTYELYTYGEPRVGNKYFAKFMNSQSITTGRVVARADIVPHVPPTSVLARKKSDYYVHRQTEFWINGEKNQKFCKRTIAEDPKCSMSMGPSYTVVDHLVYFDVNLAKTLGQPMVAAELPFGLLNPVKDLPPLPKPVEKAVGGVTGEAVDVISPGLG